MGVKSLVPQLKSITSDKPLDNTFGLCIAATK